MPANLTPEYHRAEEAYRSATTTNERLEALQWMLRSIPKHKGTDRMQADLKSRIAQAKQQIAKAAMNGGATGKRQKIGKQGIGRAILVGCPNSGKSSLLSVLTRANPVIADYPFTTMIAQPGMMDFYDVKIQIVDLPGITADFIDPETFEYVRTADLVLLVVDLSSDTIVEDTQAVLEQFEKSKTKLARTSSVDPVKVGVTYTRAMMVFNKIEAEGSKDRIDFFREMIQVDWDYVCVSSKDPRSIEKLPSLLFQQLGKVRVYSRDPITKNADLATPFVLSQGESIIDFASKIHLDLAKRVKSARVWTTSTNNSSDSLSNSPYRNVQETEANRFGIGSIVSTDYQLCDRDIVELITSN